jgi:hypothetical protein
MATRIRPEGSEVGLALLLMATVLEGVAYAKSGRIVAEDVPPS